MNRDEAQRLLDATTLRPQDVDAEARAFAEADPDLKHWLEKRAAFDERVAAVMPTLTPAAAAPAGLLEAMQAEAAKAKRPSSYRMPPVMSLWPTLAIAAVALLSFAGLWLFNVLNQRNNDWQSDALAQLMMIQEGELDLEHWAPRVESLKPLLAQAGALTPGQMPTSLLRTKTFGCRVIEVAGKPATVICFDIGSGEEAHLVVMNLDHARGLPSQRQPLLASHDGWHTASWSDGTRHYMLATTSGAQKLKALLS